MPEEPTLLLAFLWPFIGKALESPHVSCMAKYHVTLMPRAASEVQAWWSGSNAGASTGQTTMTVGQAAVVCLFVCRRRVAGRSSRWGEMRHAGLRLEDVGAVRELSLHGYLLFVAETTGSWRIAGEGALYVGSAWRAQWSYLAAVVAACDSWGDESSVSRAA